MGRWRLIVPKSQFYGQGMGYRLYGNGAFQIATLWHSKDSPVDFSEGGLVARRYSGRGILTVKLNDGQHTVYSYQYRRRGWCVFLDDAFSKVLTLLKCFAIFALVALVVVVVVAFLLTQI